MPSTLPLFPEDMNKRREKIAPYQEPEPYLPGGRARIEVNVGAFIGVTDWFTGKPPAMGWWEVRYIASEEERQHYANNGRIERQTRRWWNGKVWSWPVRVGLDSEQDAGEAASRVALADPKKLEYRGLLKNIVGE